MQTGSATRRCWRWPSSSPRRGASQGRLAACLAQQHERILAFDRHPITLEQLRVVIGGLTTHASRVIIATGSTPNERRQVEAAFARSSTERAIVLCSDAMNEGLNLAGCLRGCPPRPAYNVAGGRAAHRPGRSNGQPLRHDRGVVAMRRQIIRDPGKRAPRPASRRERPTARLESARPDLRRAPTEQPTSCSATSSTCRNGSPKLKHQAPRRGTASGTPSIPYASWSPARHRSCLRMRTKRPARATCTPGPA